MRESVLHPWVRMASLSPMHLKQTLAQHREWLRVIPAVLIFLTIQGGAVMAAGGGGAREQPEVPDFTRGGKPDDSHDWTLGPTGARGWMYAWKLDTSDARQILVTEVDKGSPADGILKPGDVILGIGGKHFETDARSAFGRAITAAESDAGGGILPMIRWRAGETEAVELRLPVMGDYAATAPYGCGKSKRIFEQGCEAIAARMKASPKRGNPIERSLNALALLASGERKYLPLVEEEARWAAAYQIKEIRGFQSWWYGYANLFLAEYVLATGDRSVVDGMRRMTMEIANGQSHVGSWGHTFADKESGILIGYGAMNSPALSLTMSLVLAREAGVSDPALDRAITRSEQLLSFYIGKGAIPYGDHNPWMETHEDNGKCGAAAIMFDFLGNKEGTAFFSRMSTASHGAERDGGHTGNFFNLLWSLPGVSRLGPQATGAWMREFGWYFDLARRWDGRFIYQEEPGIPVKKMKHRGWDSTGAYLLGYAAPLKTLRLTGRKPSMAPEIDAATADSLIADGRGWNQRTKSAEYAGKSSAELWEALRSWSPIVRKRAAGALAARKEKVLPQAIKLLESDDLHARLGACELLVSLNGGAAPAVEPLRKALRDEDLWLRIQAAEALSVIGPAANPAIPDLLKLTVWRNPADPRGMLQRYLAFVLFQKKSPGHPAGMLSGPLDGVDGKMVEEAVRAVLENQDGRARGAVVSIFERRSFEQLKPLMPAIYQAVAKQAPSGIMFADGIRLNGLAYLAKHHIREGIPLCVRLIEPDRWGQGKRYAPCLKALEAYGSAAKSELPALRELEARLAAKTGKVDPNLARVRQTIATIESATSAPELRDLPR